MLDQARQIQELKIFKFKKSLNAGDKEAVRFYSVLIGAERTKQILMAVDNLNIKNALIALNQYYLGVMNVKK
jgi:hypothetical protein